MANFFLMWCCLCCYDDDNVEGGESAALRRRRNRRGRGNSDGYEMMGDDSSSSGSDSAEEEDDNGPSHARTPQPTQQSQARRPQRPPTAQYSPQPRVVTEADMRKLSVLTDTASSSRIPSLSLSPDQIVLPGSDVQKVRRCLGELRRRAAKERQPTE